MKKLFIYITLLFSTYIFAQSKDIFAIARSGSIEEVKTLMKINPDTINAINDRGHNPLILALYRGNTTVADYLIDHVEDLNYSTKEGAAISALCMNYNKDLMNKILDKGADPNVFDGFGNNPMLFAINTQNSELLAMLLSYGAKANIKDSQGISAFELAVKTQNKEIINLLKSNKNEN